ncbi:MAG: hypothetical protein IKU13_00625 [Clostridia bacterium]|nr:hypothetical protein [Clostridia bacterium]
MKNNKKNDIKRKNNIIITMFFIYFIFALYIFFASAEHGLIRSKGFINLYNSFYWIRLILVGVVSAIFWGLYVYLMNKWEITFRCPYCNRVMETNKIVPNPAEGFMGTQTCPNCKHEFTPKIEE